MDMLKRNLETLQQEYANKKAELENGQSPANTHYANLDNLNDIIHDSQESGLSASSNGEEASSTEREEEIRALRLKLLGLQKRQRQKEGAISGLTLEKQKWKAKAEARQNSAADLLTSNREYRTRVETVLGNSNTPSHRLPPDRNTFQSPEDKPFQPSLIDYLLCSWCDPGEK
eukprot:TRINITY_DN4772_c0_g1_i1.p2 TRINITY_DN4772_c0_g1~~TRINITY_DN4772_c0_g1_i1.p2  ORF type:complete len:173 (+),score=29.64 TRINITY_DN4772_c0_g1_i1:155-673(+)